MTTLVIVESPAKAKTIAGYLGKGYEVEASFGHVRDLPERADDVPPELKKKKWAKLGVNTEGAFEPLYVVPESKKKHVSNLRSAAKRADRLLLATDEDREGESISWHIVELLKLPKTKSVERIVFHEITPEAIKAALESPRAIDERLVRAQETRRILDRLYGYTLSPVLWKKVAPKLSAGRVQSVAVRLLVERERERRAFHSAAYWDLEAQLATESDGNQTFKARLTTVDGKRLATGKSFDANTGDLKDKEAIWLKQAEAESLCEAARAARPWKVAEITTRPETEKQPPPFMTSTLQQEANRKLRFSSRRTMQIAQQLYEGIELGGERVGLITYMRTDSLTLSERALGQSRDVITNLYGADYLPPEPHRYRTKSKNAQEAHEAIRPTDLSRRPEDLKRYLDPDQLKLYELIWKRTLACQMRPAKVLRTALHVEADVSGRRLRFSASGKQIEFPGFLRAYVEGSDDPEADLGGQETLLPRISEGAAVEPKELAALEHRTKPPARLTEATLVKRLEEAGIGRPSTYASIISTIQDRGYVFKKGNELVPTFTAFAVTELLEEHFSSLVDITFTARMEDELDEIAEGHLDPTAHLIHFYRGDSAAPGLAQQVEERTPDIAFPAIAIGEDPESGEPLVVRVGRYGSYVQRGEGGKGNTASIPDDVLPADLDAEKALELLRIKNMGPKAVGKDEKSGRNIFLKTGRFGSYFEVEQTEEEAESGEKPQRISVPQDLDVSGEIDPQELALLMRLPRSLGQHPEMGEDVVASLGRYGPFVRCGKETRTLEGWRQAATMSLADAIEVLKQPKRRGRQAAAAKPPIKEFGQLEGAEGPVRVLDGRYGPYVTDGKTNATIPRGRNPEELTAEEAMELIRARAGAKKTRRGAPKKTTAKQASPKKATTKKAAPKKATAKKTSAKKASSKKTATKKAAAKSGATSESSKKSNGASRPSSTDTTASQPAGDATP